MVGEDPTTRLALIRVDGGPSPAKLAPKDDLQVGQWILALGATDGSGPWVATGVRGIARWLGPRTVRVHPTPG